MSDFEQENPHNAPEMSALFRGERGPKGDKGEPGESRLIDVAEEQVTRLIKAKAPPKWWSYVLAGLVGLVIIGSGVLGVTVNTLTNDQHQLQGNQVQLQVNQVQLQVQARAIHAQQIAACRQGNDWLARQTAIWQEVIRISTAAAPPKKNSRAYKLDQEFIRFILKTNAPRDCAHSYTFFGPPPSGPSTPLRELARIQ